MCRGNHQADHQTPANLNPIGGNSSTQAYHTTRAKPKEKPQRLSQAVAALYHEYNKTCIHGKATQQTPKTYNQTAAPQKNML